MSLLRGKKKKRSFLSGSMSASINNQSNVRGSSKVQTFLQLSVSQVRLHSIISLRSSLTRLFKCIQFNVLSVSEAFGKGFGRTVITYAASGFQWRRAILHLNCQESRPHAYKYKRSSVWHLMGMRPHFGWLAGCVD